MSTLKQPVVGIVATVLMMAVALGFVSLFSLPTFTGWVAYFLLCVIPMQIVAAVTWGANPGFVATQAQPAKGIVLTLTTLVVGVVVAALCYFTIGGQRQSADADAGDVQHRLRRDHVLARDHVGRLAVHERRQEPRRRGAACMLVACYLINYALFRVFFDYGFMKDAPVYVAAQDPHGLFPAWNALVFYLSCLAGMFFLVNFDLWPLTTVPSIMRQPVLGLVWTIAVLRARRRRVLRRRRHPGHGSRGVHGPRAGAVHLRHDRRPEHAEGIAVRGTEAAGEGRLERHRGRRDRRGAVVDVRRAGADGHGRGQSRASDVRLRDLAGVRAAQRDVPAV